MSRIYLEVSYQQKDKAKQLGGLSWDQDRKKWYTTSEHVHKFEKYKPSLPEFSPGEEKVPPESISWWYNEFKVYKKTLKEQIQEKIKSSDLNTPLSKEVESYFLKVLKHHYSFDEKIGCGMKHLEVRENHVGGITRGIWIIRNDNSECAISWLKILDQPGPPTPKSYVTKAARQEIDEQIQSFRSTDRTHVCCLCKELIGVKKNHIDHIILFDTIWTDFLGSKGMDYKDVLTIQDEQTLVKTFQDRALAEEWKMYHKDHATLRKVHERCNLQRNKK